MEVVIVGCGVSGLTSGIVLQEAGYRVRIITRELPEQTTSSVAAAIWYPYKAYPVERVLAWGRHSFQTFQSLLLVPEAGISLVTLWELFPHSVSDPWWQEAVPQFRHIAAADLPPGYADGYAVDVPLIEAPIYLAYLSDRFQTNGGTIEIGEVKTLTELAQSDRLLINCTGLGARELVGDPELYAIRGQITRLKADGPIPTILDEHAAAGLTYIIPRRDGVVIGGTAQAHDERLDVDENDAQGIWQRAIHLLPQLAGASVLTQRVGLRPGRSTVRLEREWLTPDCSVIHNYGHGGAGFTLSWGCAAELLTLA